MTFSFVTACVPVTLFLSLENKAYFFSQRFNVIPVDHKTKCGIGEDIPQYQLAFNYFADKNSTVNKKESKMKKANRNNDTTYLPWRKLTPVYPCCVSLLCLTKRYFDQETFVTEGNGLTRYIKLNWKAGQRLLSRFSYRCLFPNKYLICIEDR